MAALHIRNLPDAVKQGLRERAARHGRSMESEARAILAEAVNGTPAQAFDPGLIQAYFARLFPAGKPDGVRGLIRERRREAGREEREYQRSLQRTRKR